MPPCTVHLLALSSQTVSFLSALRSSSVEVLVVAKVIRWIILPSSISTEPLLSTPWTLLLIHRGSDALPANVLEHVRSTYSIVAGIPGRLIGNFAATNAKLLHPLAHTVPALTGSLNRPRLTDSAQSLELSTALQDFVASFSQQEGRGAVSMLNLLAFAEGRKAEYLAYGRAFAESVGVRRGGVAKLVGSVLDQKYGWDEMALAHYPSIQHFADMLASDDYQAVNQRHRVGSLRDTCILCASELSEDLLESESKAKL